MTNGHENNFFKAVKWLGKGGLPLFIYTYHAQRWLTYGRDVGSPMESMHALLGHQTGHVYSRLPMIIISGYSRCKDILAH
jgi:hypothetical protein